MIFFSIIIPVYNREDFIEKAIDSVISQNFQNWELIIIDDCSSDGTSRILEKFRNHRNIIVITNKNNIERSSSRNHGISISRGQYICFLDSDDYYLPNHLQELYSIIKSNNFSKGLFHSSVLKKTGKEITKTQVFVNQKNAVESVIQSHIPVITVAIHRAIFEDELFPANLNVNEDVFLFARIASKYPIFGHEIPTVVWVIHEDNTLNQISDFITPQIVANKLMFSDRCIGPSVSEKFKRERFHQLHSARANLFIHSPFQALKDILLAWRYQPGLAANRNNVVNFLYHLPGGSVLRTLKKFLLK